MSVFGKIGDFFVALFKTLFTSDEADKIKQSLEGFVATDTGKIAVDGVQWAETWIPGDSNDAKRAAASAKIRADLASAGKDLKTLGDSTVNWLIESALQAILAGVVAGAL